MHSFIKYFSIIFISILIVLVPVVLYFVTNARESGQSIESPAAKSNNNNSILSIEPRESELDKIVDKHFGNDKSYAIVIKNLNTGESYSFNDKKIFASASLYKLWVQAVVMQQLEDGDLKINDVVSGDKNKLDEILNPNPILQEEENSTEENTEIEPIPISFIVENAVEKMITESDNYAALLLSNKIGYKNVEQFLIDYEFNDSNYDSPPQTTASDIADFFELLYLGKIIDQEISDEMIEVLKRQTLNDRIPKYLPENIEVAHKTGELLGNKHDAGIVYSENGDYIIVVLSKTDSESIAAEKIANFSDEIYSYFQK